MPCKVCKHPKRSEIERQIAAGVMNTVEAAEIIGCHNCTISRNMSRCLPSNVRERLRAEGNELQSVSVLDQLTQSHEVTLQILDGAVSERDYRVALKALEVELKQLMFKAKLTGELSEAPQVNFVLSPEYIKLRQDMMRILGPYPELREEAAQVLLETGTVNEEPGEDGNGKNKQKRGTLQVTAVNWSE